jgi:hypothetical protein
MVVAVDEEIIDFPIKAERKRERRRRKRVRQNDAGATRAASTQAL